MSTGTPRSVATFQRNYLLRLHDVTTAIPPLMPFTQYSDPSVFVILSSTNINAFDLSDLTSKFLTAAMSVIQNKYKLCRKNMATYLRSLSAPNATYPPAAGFLVDVFKQKAKYSGVCYNEQFLSIKSGCYNARGGP
jgi:hypothetical protein